MRRALGIELRRGVGIWTALPLTVALALTVLAHPREWAGDWYGWAYYLRTSLIAFGPLVVAAAAWQGGRESRRGLTELLSSASRPALSRAWVSFASPAAWALAALVTVASAMAAVTASHTSYGRPPVLLALSAAAAVLMLASVGFVVGRLAPWRATAPLLAVAVYVGMAVLTYAQSGRQYLSPGLDLFSGYVPAPWWAPLSAAMFLALGVAALLLLADGRRWWAAPALGLAILAAVPIASTGQDAFTADEAGEQLVCARGDPEVCLTRRHADQLPRVAAVVQAVLAGLDTPGPVVEQRVGPGLPDQTGTLNTLYLGADLSGSADLEVVRQDAAQRAVAWNCDGFPSPSDDSLSIATYELADWARERPRPPYGGALQGRTPQQALSLIKQFATAASHCDLAAARALLATPP
ncbi:MAG TPA: hypothetical protein VFR07_13140 [Mycobacteriales bacterium]|jgi:hypothetical protein|nr:hypothetical protein [Mycobacteriales bacterium]